MTKLLASAIAAVLLGIPVAYAGDGESDMGKAHYEQVKPKVVKATKQSADITLAEKRERDHAGNSGGGAAEGN